MTGTFVYLLQHVRSDSSGTEDVKALGVYSSESAALRAVDYLKAKPGFREYPEGFHVDKYQLDKVEWAEGFVK